MKEGDYMIPMSVSYFINFLKKGLIEYDLKMGSIHRLPSTTTYYKWSIEVGEFYGYTSYYEIRRNRKTGGFQYREWKNCSQIWEDPVWTKWTKLETI
jgi:hypothetical protein